MMKPDKQLKFKGVMIARRGYCEFAKSVYKDLLNMILNDVPILEIKHRMESALNDLMNGKVDISKLTMTKSVKDIDAYNTNVPQRIMAQRLTDNGRIILAGQRLEYVFVKSESTMQGHKMYSPEEIEKMALEIDYYYYFDKQIVNQIAELLELVGLRIDESNDE